MGRPKNGCGFNKKCEVCFPLRPFEAEDGEYPGNMVYGPETGMGLRYRGTERERQWNPTTDDASSLPG